MADQTIQVYVCRFLPECSGDGSGGDELDLRIVHIREKNQEEAFENSLRGSCGSQSLAMGESLGDPTWFWYYGPFSRASD
jgi:hypothetical protein